MRENNFGEIHINEHGGKQSKLELRFDLIPASVLREIATVLGYGAKRYGINNWILTTFEENLNHALYHINCHMMGIEPGENHLSHALVRMIFAYYLSSKNPEELEAEREAYRQKHSIRTQEIFEETSEEQVEAYRHIDCKETAAYSNEQSKEYQKAIIEMFGIATPTDNFLDSLNKEPTNNPSDLLINPGLGDK